MRPTFMGFEMSKRAIYTNQKALDIVGHNLSNVNTAGYTRQRVEVTSVAVNNDLQRINNGTLSLTGQGSQAIGVEQLRDIFVDQRFREEYSNAAYHGKSAELLESIQVAIGDGNDITDESGLYGGIKNLYEALNDFIKDPTSHAQANVVMSEFKNITQVLRQIDTNLTNAAQQHIEDLSVDVDRVNEITAQIAHLNKVISEDAVVLSDPDNEFFRPNELYDERNLLLDELAMYGNITATENEDGTVDVQMGEHYVVDGKKSDNLNLIVNDNNTVVIEWSSSGESIGLTGGTLLASIHYLNGRGTNVQDKADEPYQGIPYYRDQMDNFANALADLANTTLPEIDPATGGPLKDAAGNTVYKTLLGGKDETGATNKYFVNAENITISDEWNAAGPGYFIFSEDENVEDYAQQIAATLVDNSFTFDSHGEIFEGSFVDFEVNILSKLGSDISFNVGRQEAYGQIADDFLDQRDAVSGVSSDEETANMMMYQKSYNAAARVMTTLDEMLDTIINRMGRVGL